MNTIAKLVACLAVATTNCIYRNWDPKEYENSNIGQFKHAAKELSKLALHGAESILDIGCGDGKISRYMATEYVPRGHVVGIDNSASMISFANSHASAVNVSFQYGDACAYQSAKKFDVVTSFWCLHWTENYAAALSNIASLLNPGGKTLLCHVVNKHPLSVWVERVLQQEKWAPYRIDVVNKLNVPTLERVVEAIHLSGLEIENMEVKKNSEWIPFATYKQNLIATPLFECVIEQKRVEFCNQVIEEYLPKNPLNEKGEFYHWVPVVILVLKK